MKLLLVSVKSTVSRGGIATWTDYYLSQCSKHGIDCTLVNTEQVAHRRKARRNIADEFHRTKRIFKDLKKCLRNSFDAAHLNTSCGTYGLFRDYLVARKIKGKGIPVVVHYHCDIPYWIHNPISRKVLGMLAKLADGNLVLCENSSRYLQEQFGIASTKVPNFIDESLVLDVPKNISEKIQRIFFVGRVTEAKGAAEMYALAKRFPHITFELLGDVGAAVAAWEKPDNVILPGGKPHEQVIARLDKADLFLFPSYSEGFSVALMESMARGVSAVATDVGANADMLSDDCGIVVHKGDVDAMEQAIRALEDPQKRAEMSRNAVEKVRTCYTTDAIIQLLKSSY